MTDLLRVLLKSFFSRPPKERDDTGRFQGEESKASDQLEIARTTHEEARTVLDHQIEVLDDTDDKAARTVRITVLLFGAVLGATTVGNSNGIPLDNPFVLWGSINVVLSIVLGMATYNVSQPYLGIKGEEIDQLLHETEDELDLLTLLLEEGYEDWISETGYLNWKNSVYFDLTQISLAVGLGYLILGALHSVANADKLPRLYPLLESILEFQGIWLPTIAITTGSIALVIHSLYRRIERARNS